MRLTRLIVVCALVALVGCAHPVVRVEVRQSGETVVSGVPEPGDALDRRLAALAREDPSSRLEIVAEPGVPHGSVVDVMDRARRAGLTRITMRTVPPPPPEPAPAAVREPVPDLDFQAAEPTSDGGTSENTDPFRGYLRK